jgi:oligopeptide/dipeptide ABC transporter ATP-binding protein
LQDEFGLSLLFIAHDLSLVRHLAHRTAVMYLGKVVESGETENVINRPRHPYTLALRSAVPHLGGPGMGQALAGEIPSVAEPPSGCRFRSRCRFAQARCAEEEPALRVFDGRMVACHFAEEIANHAQNVPSAE